jgi:hypothetical protein
MRNLELNQNELILLRKLVELHVKQLDLFIEPSTDDKLKEKGRMAMQSINKSTAKSLMKKIDEVINNQNY